MTLDRLEKIKRVAEAREKKEARREKCLTRNPRAYLGSNGGRCVACGGRHLRHGQPAVKRGEGWASVPCATGVMRVKEALGPEACRLIKERAEAV